jgi:hypothetical protein
MIPKIQGEGGEVLRSKLSQKLLASPLRSGLNPSFI